MQLDATLRTFALHCRDPHLISLKVLYRTTGDHHEEQYRLLGDFYPTVNFVPETEFKNQLLNLLEPHEFILFLVDDNLFVREFSMQQIMDSLQRYPHALGYSLRLGMNTTYCYAYGCDQEPPAFQAIENDALLFDWATAQLDFAYALEVSSSCYRNSDLYPLLQVLPFSNPNMLETLLSALRGGFLHKRYLICSRNSVTFCNPVNKVQQVCTENRAGEMFSYSAEDLSDLFEQGYRVDVRRYIDYLPRSCHEEVELYFILIHQQEVFWVADKRPVSFFIPAYNCEKTLEESVQSIMEGNFSEGDELVIVNDGSTDGTECLIDRLALRYPGIRKINHVGNKGGAAARNTAIENTRHEILFCLDSDNLLEPGSIQKLKGFLLQNRADVATFAEIRFFQGRRANITHKWVFNAETTLADCLASHVVPGASGNYMFTKNSWRRAGGYPEFAGAMDSWGFGFRLLATGSKMLSMPDSYYLHRYGYDSYWIRENKKGKILMTILQIILPYLDFIQDEDVDYMMSREGRYNWYNHLQTRPIRLKSGVTGSGGKVVLGGA